MKNIFFLIAWAFTLSVSAQYVSSSFVTLNEGMDQAYLDIEMLWKVYHQDAIQSGRKTGWSIWKVSPENYDDKVDASRIPHYLIVETFATKEALDQEMASYNEEGLANITKLIKQKFKGKISARKIDQILSKDVNKERRTYIHQGIAQTPFTGGGLKPGDKMVLAPMEQLQEDYEQYETEFYQKVFADNVMKGNHRWWGFTKIIDRSENALGFTTHAAWNIGFDGKTVEFPQDFVSQKIISITGAARKMYNPVQLELIYVAD